MTHPNESEARELLVNHSFQLKRGRDPAVSAVAATLTHRDSERRRADEAEAELARVKGALIATKYWLEKLSPALNIMCQECLSDIIKDQIDPFIVPPAIGVDHDNQA